MCIAALGGSLLLSDNSFLPYSSRDLELPDDLIFIKGSEIEIMLNLQVFTCWQLIFKNFEGLCEPRMLSKIKPIYRRDVPLWLLSTSGLGSTSDPS